MGEVEWFAVDWGTSNLRIWACNAQNEIVQTFKSNKGMSTLQPDEFEPTLLDVIGGYLTTPATPVMCCGMVGARQGWAEATYASAPCKPPNGVTALKVQAVDPRLDVRILPGVMQASPADVMRGEETQIAGFLAQNPDFMGTLCLPGTHTKWVQISAGEIVSFRTFMTGELFALIGGQSVLRHSVQGGDWSENAFFDAVEDAMTSPQQLAARLFGIRAEGLVNGLEQGEAKARLSGFLIGMELAAARPYWLGQEVAIIGDTAVKDLYGNALGRQGVPGTSYDAADMTLAGLNAAYAVLKKERQPS
ncbi:MAG: 2-dehydro-3-deoxygalactonokinase [Planktomarina sp.]